MKWLTVPLSDRLDSIENRYSLSKTEPEQPANVVTLERPSDATADDFRQPNVRDEYERFLKLLVCSGLQDRLTAMQVRSEMDRVRCRVPRRLHAQRGASDDDKRQLSCACCKGLDVIAIRDLAEGIEHLSFSAVDNPGIVLRSFTAKQP